jgi:hypothetical protein
MLQRRADTLAREHTERAVATIAEIMDDTFAEDRDRLSAAREILDRGHGKPAQAVVQLPASRQQAIELATLTDAELIEAINDAPLPSLVAPKRDPLLD